MLSAAKLSTRERAELIMKAPAWGREPNDADWTFLTCPRCSCTLLVGGRVFKMKTLGRIMVPCIYCGAYSRKPGTSLTKVERMLKKC